MAQTNYSKNTVRAPRRAGTLERSEWQRRAREFCARGDALPQTKLKAEDVRTIRSAQRQRLALLQYIRENLSNAALAKHHGVSVRSIEDIVSRRKWCHVA